MPKYTDPAKRYRIRHEPNRKGKQYVAVFTKRWYDAKDPAGASPELRKKTSFATLTEAKAWAKDTADQADTSGHLEGLALNLQSQILGLASELKVLGGDPATLLSKAIKIKRAGTCELKSIEEGSQLVELAEDHLEDSLGDWIDKYATDPNQMKNRTHNIAVSNLNVTFVGLRDIPLKHLQTEQSAVAALTPVIQAYVDKPTVKRKRSLQNLRSRLRQLLSYTKTHTGIPSKVVLDHLSNLTSYKDLKHNLEDGKEDYALSSAEVLVMIKHFSRKECFCPTYPVIAAMMGARTSLYNELTWDHMGGKGRLGDATVNIPKNLLKTVRQGKTNRGLKFLMKEIPNLSTWLWWCLWQEYRLGIKKHGSIRQNLLRTLSPRDIREERNKCLVEWRDFFECEVDDDDEFCWNNAAINGFRNSFVTYGVRHPTLRDNVSKIADDYKSHKHYTDKASAENDLEARVLWELNPFYLDLVDAENKTVDTTFLYADLETKEQLWEDESDKYKKEVYRRILEGHGIFPDSTSMGAELEELDQDSLLEDERITDLIPDNEFFKNVTKEQLLYWTYSLGNAANIKEWVDDPDPDEWTIA